MELYLGICQEFRDGQAGFLGKVNLIEIRSKFWSFQMDLEFCKVYLETLNFNSIRNYLLTRYAVRKDLLDNSKLSRKIEEVTAVSLSVLEKFSESNHNLTSFKAHRWAIMKKQDFSNCKKKLV